jgi:hypothetical protein
MVPVYQIYRYYNGKTTRKHVVIALLVGEGYFIFTAIVINLLTFGYDSYHAPLAFQLIFGILVLWRFRIPEPTAPWKSEEETKSWWDKEPEDQEEKREEKPAKDDDDVLW